ncbi:alpha/beta hydrolase family protein [Pseudoduganella namucuonensis]|uniref:Dipeptidyl aminopeptidase/acylaminoacyl peptidase n=1 Tax=Pseudoduganella namucuonensis TaxID=1035707 RepID=A0A1I7KJY5_9BURK|nr:alpha/beta fold hydrolase [Pseudoduganella namucuonensis]SFU97696.1 Dipeptidyl aminopeptidase/acylaminoacyl peptidase [Pseudoduganella namucuonensis]
MTRPLARPLARLLALSALSLLLAAPARAEPPPASAFFNNARYSAAKLSPSGRHLAMRARGQLGRDALLVVTLADKSAKMVAQFSNIDIDDFEWVNDNRLVYDTRDSRSAPGDWTHAPGLFAVNRDGGGFLQLVDRGYDRPAETGTHIRTAMMPWNTYLLGQEGAQDSDSVYVYQPERRAGERRGIALFKLNTLTARAQGVPRPANMQRVVLDAQGEPRVATSSAGGTAAVHYRDPDSGAWRKLRDFPAYGDAPGAFSPVGLGTDGMLYVSTSAGTDRAVVRTYDVATNTLGDKPLIELGEYDFSGRLVTGGGRILGVRLLTDARSTHWWNADMRALQEKVDSLLPGTVNQISVARRPETPAVLITSWSDRQPPVYVLYDRESGALTKLGEAHPEIKPDAMGERELIHYTARDGMRIPAWLTLPPGGAGKKLPLVVLVHGGPYMRGGEWKWDADSQFLATRGYAVLEPEFRGGTGFGTRHFRAGWKQWGLAMQDDLADGARAMVARGVADGGRICIAGASYGGYAALMGLVKDPDLFKCAVNWVGVTDINLLYTGTWQIESDLPEAWKQYGMPQLIGDPVADAAQFKATSPLEQAARVRQPVLMAYGNQDARVPLAHGQRFHDAVKAHNAQAELVVYDGEGHGWTLEKNRVDFWTRVEKFLGRHIGPQAKSE